MITNHRPTNFCQRTRMLMFLYRYDHHELIWSLSSTHPYHACSLPIFWKLPNGATIPWSLQIPTKIMISKSDPIINPVITIQSGVTIRNHFFLNCYATIQAETIPKPGRSPRHRPTCSDNDLGWILRSIRIWQISWIWTVAAKNGEKRLEMPKRHHEKKLPRCRNDITYYIYICKFMIYDNKYNK